MRPGAMPEIHFFTQADNQVSKSGKSQKKSKQPKYKYRLTNWSEYNNALINRGFISLWFNEDTLANWYYQGTRRRGGVIRYSEQCIEVALTLKSVLRLAFRQTQGLIQSLLYRIKSYLAYC